ncbi:predicted protein [Sclerotinia sclerotiorum 1980 UF-70]|uniref:Uncharacterized protein n=1 Tax=Sclerotinia sclerotiorum (strain ATCC 18683 / 1980 / Ss-1) TaxID=665079 RepID=A7EBW1_SCLS1|nr:predicted protein [Sclerotinia sclerotiorum 1980 UF-70]EDN99939.1 predicted protein [Sclerotinia sclerotiorum 1980 UF-70]
MYRPQSSSQSVSNSFTSKANKYYPTLQDADLGPFMIDISDLQIVMSTDIGTLNPPPSSNPSIIRWVRAYVTLVSKKLFQNSPVRSIAFSSMAKGRSKKLIYQADTNYLIISSTRPEYST